MFPGWSVCILLVILPAVVQRVPAVSVSCNARVVLEHGDLYCTCSLGNTTSSVRWTLAYSTGRLTDLGTCKEVDSCSSNVSPGIKLLRITARNSSLHMHDLDGDDTGNVVCEEHYTNGSVVTANFTLVVVSVSLSPCDSGEYDVTEGTNVSLKCDVSNPTSPITWSLVTPSGHSTPLGTCHDDVSNCTSSLSPYIELSREVTERHNGLKRVYSHMTINGIKRDSAGTITCSDGKQTSYCSLDVQHETLVSSCGLEVHSVDWTAEMWFKVTFAFSALGRYEFSIHKMWKPKSSRYYFEQFSPLFDGQQSFDPRNFTSSGKEFYEGTYSYAWRLPVEEGTYTYRSVTFPGKVTRRVETEVHIERPLPPNVRCELSPRESVPATCVCSTPSVGRPAGRLLWLSGDTVLAAGQYGVAELHLPARKLRHDKEIVNILCQLDWIVKENVSIAETFSDGSTTITWAGVIVGGVVVLIVVVVVVAVMTALWRRGRLPCGTEIITRSARANPSNHTPVHFDAARSYDTEQLIS